MRLAGIGSTLVTKMSVVIATIAEFLKPSFGCIDVCLEKMEILG